MNQQQVHKIIGKLLEQKYKNVINTKDYIVAIGDIPIALVAHMDTVFSYPCKELYYDKLKGVLFSPDGLGADDRAGIFSILQIIKDGLRPSIILTTDEEQGGLGAAALALDYPTCPIPDLKYMIELDRRGSYDAVFYDCDTADFKDYIEQFGFLEARGSFSDISFLMGEWQKCGVNLSIGYENEHTHSEILNINHMFSTIEKVKKMLCVENIPDFIYEEAPIFKAINKAYNFDFGVKCWKCHTEFNDYQTIPVKALDGTTRFYCPDCIHDIEWCGLCGEAYECASEDKSEMGVCYDCRRD